MAYKTKYDYLNNEEELRREIEEHKKIVIFFRNALLDGNCVLLLDYMFQKVPNRNI